MELEPTLDSDRNRRERKQPDSERSMGVRPVAHSSTTVKRFNSAKLKSTPAFITEKAPHFFKVKAGDANTDLTITVKDEFGHTWTENMQRPKAFSIDTYKAN